MNKTEWSKLNEILYLKSQNFVNIVTVNWDIITNFVILMQKLENLWKD